ncbi:MAG TPA: NAD(P)-dependent glycerol-3-phosphate dehydrogenase [Candidatus Acetothermia bacterium]|nr:NAD(P)-dependent glycerol-3-phosphate dehydrogenase [Candidatus Acetothermia bacterium]
MSISVIGAGGWGTAFSRLQARSGRDVTLWARQPRVAEAIDKKRENVDYLPGIKLPHKHLRVTSSLSEAIAAETIVLAVPSFAMRGMMEQIAALGSEKKVYVNLAKGLDRDSHQTMSEIITEAVDARGVFTLSGPSHAEEVGRDIPTAVVLAGRDQSLGRELQTAFSTPRFRVYSSGDIHGVELCAAVKNIIAIATGMSDGLGFGDNTRAALITRGLAEMVRFGRAYATSERTFFGLAGLGDLVATCTSKHSRNRFVGSRIGKGESISQIMADMKMVAEGVYATEIVYLLAQEKKIEMPITEAVYRILYRGADPREMVDEMMTRPPKDEEA